MSEAIKETILMARERGEMVLAQEAAAELARLESALAAVRDVLRELDTLTNQDAIMFKRDRLFQLDLLGDKARSALAAETGEEAG